MSGVLTFGAALLLGLSASGHCLIMCGGITAALGMAAAKDSEGRTRPTLLIGYQLGRISAYSLAGLMFAGMFGSLIGFLDIESVRQTLRALSALALFLAALVAFGRLRDPGSAIGGKLWRQLAPLGRRLLPVNTLPRAFAFGMVWGWMPCGFVYFRSFGRHVAAGCCEWRDDHGRFWLRHRSRNADHIPWRATVQGVRCTACYPARRRIRAAAQRRADARWTVGGALVARAACLASVSLRRLPLKPELTYAQPCPRFEPKSACSLAVGATLDEFGKAGIAPSI